MARHRRDRAQRDDNSIANSPLLDNTTELLREDNFSNPFSDPLRELEDRRLFHPDAPFEPARSLFERSDADVIAKPTVVRKTSPSYLSPDTFHYAQPANVATCIRRKERREVLFAKRKTGKGSKRRDRRYNERSEVKC